MYLTMFLHTVKPHKKIQHSTDKPATLLNNNLPYKRIHDFREGSTLDL